MFENGAEVIRFDCHLHTKKDKEFKYNGEENQFVNNYVEKLEAAGIGVGILTNHNKFDEGEYKAIKKNARKKDILILPGVERSYSSDNISNISLESYTSEFNEEIFNDAKSVIEEFLEFVKNNEDISIKEVNYPDPNDNEKVISCQKVIYKKRKNE